MCTGIDHAFFDFFDLWIFINILYATAPIYLQWTLGSTRFTIFWISVHINVSWAIFRVVFLLFFRSFVRPFVHIIQIVWIQRQCRWYGMVWTANSIAIIIDTIAENGFNLNMIVMDLSWNVHFWAIPLFKMLKFSFLRLKHSFHSIWIWTTIDYFSLFFGIGEW